MDSTTQIFWFSGTGNSLFAAKCLAAELGDARLANMADGVPPGAIGGEGTKIGFVFPSYYCNLPRLVRGFIEKLDIRPGTYIFGIVTMGAIGQGTVNALRKALNEKGLKLNYGRGIRMPANYVVVYNPADPEKSGATLDKVMGRLRAFAADIKEGKQLTRPFPYTGTALYKDIERLDRGFAANDSCTGCGLCEKLCPARNITMESGKPKWQGRCERCVACISWCPSKAIDYENSTQSRRRYRNPQIKADELSR